MANINPVTGGVKVKRFNSGGIVLVGANTLLNIKAGSLKWKPGLRSPIQISDRGILTDVIEGDERPSELELDVFYTSLATAGELYALLSAYGSAGLANTLSIVAKFPNGRGAVTGESVTFANCYVPEGGLSFETASGNDVDSLKVKLMDAEAKPVVAAY